MFEDESGFSRLNKAISDTGYCSRREADMLITEGRVTINGKKATMGDKARLTDHIKIDGKLLKRQSKLVYIALNKPKGITSTTERHIAGNIIDYVNHAERIFPIGRLDKLSEGLILLTNDGNIVNKILRAGNNHEKEYVVTVNKPITAEFIQNMRKGVPVLNTVTEPCHVVKETTTVFRIILKQGLNRQIRRMCEYLGYEVTKLKRVRIMNITLDKIPVGAWRDLRPEELETISRLISESSKTEEASRSKVSTKFYPADKLGIGGKPKVFERFKTAGKPKAEDQFKPGDKPRPSGKPKSPERAKPADKARPSGNSRTGRDRTAPKSGLSKPKKEEFPKKNPRQR